MNVFGNLLASMREKWWTKLWKDGVVNLRLVLLGILGVALLLTSGFWDSTTVTPKTGDQQDAAKNPAVITRNYEETLELKLANLLSQVRGAGAVAVSITLENGDTREYAEDVTKESRVIQEKDNNGGLRTTTETKESDQILLSKENGNDQPIIVRETKPEIKGVLVIAEGAQDSTVKANITWAVEAGLGVPAYKISVLPQKM